MMSTRGGCVLWGLLDGHSVAASGFPPLLDPDYKLEADCKFCVLPGLAVNHACQRLDPFLRSGEQHMLPGSAVPVSHNACTSRTHIFSDRPHIKLRFVQAQKVYRHCPRSALFISATKCMH